jgi:hypothetical protein
LMSHFSSAKAQITSISTYSFSDYTKATSPSLPFPLTQRWALPKYLAHTSVWSWARAQGR